MAVIRHQSGDVLLDLGSQPGVSVSAGEKSPRLRLHGIQLNGLDLSGADFRRAWLKSVDFTGSILRDCEFSETDISYCKFLDADLRGSSFTDAELSYCDFDRARLCGTVLNDTHTSECSFLDTDFSDSLMFKTVFALALLKGANFEHVYLADAVFTGCSELHVAIGLGDIYFSGPSALDLETIRASIVELPIKFLEGIGYTHEEIEVLHALYSRGIRFYSCFISHAEADLRFAEKLRSDLIENNVSCWHYGHDMEGGKHWRTQVQTAIKLHDKLLLVCSHNSVFRQNVVEEIIDAIEMEQRSGEQKLFPIRLDNSILSRETSELARSKVASGEWRMNWVQYVQAYHISDFRNWEDDEEYSLAVRKLIRDLLVR